MGITIREAEPRDAQQMIGFAQRLSEETDIDVALVPGEFTLTVEQEEQIILDYAASENSAFFLAEADGEIVGLLNCLGGKRDARRHVTSLGISVRRDWRNRGVGDALMKYAIDWARNTGTVRRIELSVFERNQGALHLYRKHGFVVEGHRRRSVFRNGKYIDDLIMAKWLDSD